MIHADLDTVGEATMRLLLATLTCLGLIAGCATTRTTYAPDGRKAYTLNCSGWPRGWNNC